MSAKQVTDNDKEKKTTKKFPKYSRVIIENVSPKINDGLFPIKRVAGDIITVRATIFTDGHDEIYAQLLYRYLGQKLWDTISMDNLGNDCWEARFSVKRIGTYLYTIRSGIDCIKTWLNAVNKKYKAGIDFSSDIPFGIQILNGILRRAKGEHRHKLKKYTHLLKSQDNYTKIMEILTSTEFNQLLQKYPDKKQAIKYEKELKVTVERQKALFSTWYEMFPRSCGAGKNHGTFNDCINLLPDIAKMGFDVVYFPPIHPVGEVNRKGRNNRLLAKKDDPGSPWAIGSKLGGHTSIEPMLGTLSDFKHLLKKAQELSIEIAIDIAFQCSPDHPYIKSHPEWFRFLPDGSIQYAENPPKKYEDIVSFDFDSHYWKELWEELKRIFLFWIDTGIKIFRVDNPHTKPFVFWDWIIEEIKKDYPDVIFLSEAFTRPHRMYRLAKGGFSQSYTYFTWRNTKQEFIDYVNELTTGEVSEYFRPNFWPNTPDILPKHLQYGGRPAFILRLILAATLSSNYGIYGPAFELCVIESMPEKEEYNNSEKYEIKDWDRNKEGNLRGLIELVNKIRRQNPALQRTNNVKFCYIDNDCLLSYYKVDDVMSNIILVVVNMDPYHIQIGNIHVPINEIGIKNDQIYSAHDLLSGDTYHWRGSTNYIELNPKRSPAHILLLIK